jgi:rhodanese/phosphatase family protein
VTDLPPAPWWHAYWAAPGLLAGAYPGSHDPSDAEVQVDLLCSAGVTLFIDLTGRGDRLTPYEGLLPPSARRIAVPIQDSAAPARPLVEKVLETIDAELAAGGIVYVHCRVGIGRTGVIVGCWLAAHGEADPIGELVRLRAECASAYLTSPESPEQHRLVRSWARSAP